MTKTITCHSSCISNKAICTVGLYLSIYTDIVEILEQRCVADDARLRFTSQMVQRLVSLNASALCIAGCEKTIQTGREIVASISLQSWVILEQRCVPDDARLRFTSQMVPHAYKTDSVMVLTRAQSRLGYGSLAHCTTLFFTKGKTNKLSYSQMELKHTFAGGALLQAVNFRHHPSALSPCCCKSTAGHDTSGAI